MVILPIEFSGYSSDRNFSNSRDKAADKKAVARDADDYRAFVVTRIERESETIASFYLEPEDGIDLAPHEPGQHLPVMLEIPGQQRPVFRTYSISDAPNGRTYRLSVKREEAPSSDTPPGLASNYFHNHIELGARIFAGAPKGDFKIDSNDQPLVLLSGGVGITPMIAMTNHLTGQCESSRLLRKTWFVHGALNSRTHAFAEHLRVLAANFENLRVHFRYSDPSEEDKIGVTHDSEGYINIDFLNTLLPKDDYEYYLCGPLPFMRIIYQGLCGLDVPCESIHYEFFGPPSSLDATDSDRSDASDSEEQTQLIEVIFAKSDLTVRWNPAARTLLELAEEHGLRPAYGCRSGMCGSCAVDVLSGAVEHIRKPMFEVGSGQTLICFSTPKSGPRRSKSEAIERIVLDV